MKQTSSPNTKQSVALDLSGRIKLHISSPKDEEDKNNEYALSESLFQIGTNRQFYTPSIVVGALYNFHERWYGIKRIFSTFSWNNLNQNKRQAHRRSLEITSETAVNEKNHWMQPNDSSFEIKLEQSNLIVHKNIDEEISPTILSVRLDTNPRHIRSVTPTTTFCFQSPVYRCFSIRAMWIFCVSQTSTIIPPFTFLRSFATNSSFQYKRTRLQNSQPSLHKQMPALYDIDSMVPQFQIGGDGYLTSNSEYGWYIKKKEKKRNESMFMKEGEKKNNINHRHQNLNEGLQSSALSLIPSFSRMGFKLKISKQLHWSWPFQNNDKDEEDEEDDIKLQMEIMGLESNQQILNSIVFQAKGPTPTTSFDFMDFWKSKQILLSREEIMDYQWIQPDGPN